MEPTLLQRILDKLRSIEYQVIPSDTGMILRFKTSGLQLDVVLSPNKRGRLRVSTYLESTFNASRSVDL